VFAQNVDGERANGGYVTVHDRAEPLVKQHLSGAGRSRERLGDRQSGAPVASAVRVHQLALGDAHAVSRSFADQCTGSSEQGREACWVNCEREALGRPGDQPCVQRREARRDPIGRREVPRSFGSRFMPPKAGDEVVDHQAGRVAVGGRGGKR
jgi:hypothetical protein